MNAGADIESKTELDTTPLHIASGLNNDTNVMILLSAGANIEAKDCYGTYIYNYLLRCNNNIITIRSYSSCRCSI